MTTEQSAQTSQKKRRWPMLAAVVVMVACVGFGAYSFYAWRKAVSDNPTAVQKDIIQSVNDIAITPSGTPEIATVKDASKLTSGALAKVAKNGDQLLIYSQANRIFVYRPTVRKLVDILSVQAPSAGTTSANVGQGTTQSSAPQNLQKK